jgi:hypothetical protein
MEKYKLSARVPEETIKIIDTISTKTGLNRSKVIEAALDMLVGNFTYEDIVMHASMVDFADYRAGRVKLAEGF